MKFINTIYVKGKKTTPYSVISLDVTDVTLILKH